MESHQVLSLDLMLTRKTTFWLCSLPFHYLLSGILCFTHMTPLTVLRKDKVVSSLHSVALISSPSPYRENSYSAFKTQLSS